MNNDDVLECVQVRAFNSWSAAKAQGGGADRAFCARNYLSAAAMNMLDGMRTQLLSELLSRRLITSLAESSVNAQDAGLVRFVLVRSPQTLRNA